VRIIGQMTYLPGLRGLRLLRAAEPVITCISKHRRASYFRQAHRGDDGLLPRFPRRVFSGCSGRMPGVIGQSEDAFGAALVDYLEGRDVPGLVLEVEGDRAGPAMHPEWFFRGVERWEWWDQQLLPLIGQGPVLDLGAGAGRASLYLQERGLAVTAVDASPGAVEVCRRRGGGLMLAWVMSMTRQLISGGLACCCYTGILAWAAPGRALRARCCSRRSAASRRTLG
jgi:hypothetical protein